jgi:hypothetical protein
MATRKQKTTEPAPPVNVRKDMSTASTIIVFRKGDGTVAVSHSLPPGVSMSGKTVDRYRVHGSRPLGEFAGVSSVAEFESWKKARESEGFVFEPFPIF